MAANPLARRPALDAVDRGDVLLRDPGFRAPALRRLYPFSVPAHRLHSVCCVAGGQRHTQTGLAPHRPESGRALDHIHHDLGRRRHPLLDQDLGFGPHHPNRICFSGESVGIDFRFPALACAGTDLAGGRGQLLVRPARGHGDSVGAVDRSSLPVVERYHRRGCVRVLSRFALSTAVGTARKAHLSPGPAPARLD